MASAAAPPRPPAKQRPAPLPPPRFTYHQIRKAIHLVCFLIFVALPFTDLMRVDIPNQRFYFLGSELWINEFGIIFFTMMFLLFAVVATSMLYGRMYCSYLCPQMIFSEWSLAVENWLVRKINKKLPKWPVQRKRIASRACFYMVLALASIFLAFVFTSYFVEPRDLLRRLLAFDMHTAGGITGAIVTLVAFLDFTLLRQRFCTAVCPYGYLQGMLGDDNTLLVHYRDDNNACIECKKCVRVCHMEIDIRESPFQIECIHCGECVDACQDVLRRLGRKTLIHYAWGAKGELLEAKAPWYLKFGLRDPKRVAIMLVIFFYACGLYAALTMRRQVLVQVSPVRTELYKVDSAGLIRNRFRVKIANRGKQRSQVKFEPTRLPDAQLLLDRNPIVVDPGQVIETEFDIAVKQFRGSELVNHFALLASTDTEKKTDSFDQTFLMPPEKK
ncbi:MAG: 4Fe-4S binding protein [Bryobacterales bacterium]|nr:4Fe-4S binding protein [Bryobacterales bacterium]